MYGWMYVCMYVCIHHRQPQESIPMAQLWSSNYIDLVSEVSSPIYLPTYLPTYQPTLSSSHRLPSSHPSMSVYTCVSVCTYIPMYAHTYVRMYVWYVGADYYVNVLFHEGGTNTFRQMMIGTPGGPCGDDGALCPLADARKYVGR